MKEIISLIDHIVFCVPDMELGLRNFTTSSGIIPEKGGQHMTKGTHNYLIGTGDRSYFEILASDPSNKNFEGERWMGIDAISAPRITRWAMRTSDITMAADNLRKIKDEKIDIISGSRKKINGELLNWKMTNPGAYPAIDLIPFFIDWQDSLHPASLLNHPCELEELKLSHPDPDKLFLQLEALGVNLPITYSIRPIISVTISTPRGTITFE